MPDDAQKPQQLEKREKMDRFVVYVDQQAKRSFDTKKAADKEAQRISESFPIVSVHVAESENDSISRLTETTKIDETVVEV